MGSAIALSTRPVIVLADGDALVRPQAGDRIAGATPIASSKGMSRASELAKPITSTRIDLPDREAITQVAPTGTGRSSAEIVRPRICATRPVTFCGRQSRTVSR